MIGDDELACVINELPHGKRRLHAKASKRLHSTIEKYYDDLFPKVQDCTISTSELWDQFFFDILEFLEAKERERNGNIHTGYYTEYPHITPYGFDGYCSEEEQASAQEESAREQLIEKSIRRWSKTTSFA